MGWGKKNKQQDQIVVEKQAPLEAKKAAVKETVDNTDSQRAARELILAANTVRGAGPSQGPLTSTHSEGAGGLGGNGDQARGSLLGADGLRVRHGDYPARRYDGASRGGALIIAQNFHGESKSVFGKVQGAVAHRLVSRWCVPKSRLDCAGNAFN
jgi:hypothetical protein